MNTQRYRAGLHKDATIKSLGDSSEIIPTNQKIYTYNMNHYVCFFNYEL